MAADAGFFPPGDLVLLADIARKVQGGAQEEMGLMTSFFSTANGQSVEKDALGQGRKDKRQQCLFSRDACWKIKGNGKKKRRNTKGRSQETMSKASFRETAVSEGGREAILFA